MTMTKIRRQMRKMIRKVVDNMDSYGLGYPVRVMTEFQDDRGSWLYVSFSDMDDCGVTPYSFTAFSRIDEKGMYLEEMDAEIFEKAYARATGFRIVLNEVHEEPSPVRQKQNNTIAVAKAYWEKRPPPFRLRIVRGSRDTVDVDQERNAT